MSDCGDCCVRVRVAPIDRAICTRVIGRSYLLGRVHGVYIIVGLAVCGPSPFAFDMVAKRSMVCAVHTGQGGGLGSDGGSGEFTWQRMSHHVF